MTEKMHNRLLSVMLILFLGVGFGYAWRMKHESVAAEHYVMMPPNSLVVADLSQEISKGKEFWLPVNNDTMLHFLPLSGARYQMAIRHEPIE